MNKLNSYDDVNTMSDNRDIALCVERMKSLYMEISKVTKQFNELKIELIDQLREQGLINKDREKVSINGVSIEFKKIIKVDHEKAKSLSDSWDEHSEEIVNPFTKKVTYHTNATKLSAIKPDCNMADIIYDAVQIKDANPTFKIDIKDSHIPYKENQEEMAQRHISSHYKKGN